MLKRHSLFSALAFIGLLLGIYVGQNAWTQPAAGLPNEGPVVGWLLPVISLISTLLSIVTLGVLVVAIFIAPTTHATVSPQGRRDLIATARLATLWFVTEIFTAVLTLASVLGLPLREVFAPGVISTYIFDLAPARAHLISALCAIIIAIVSLMTISLDTVLVLVLLAIAGIAAPLLNSHSASLGDHSLAVTSSLIHGVAISLWVGGLLALIPYVLRGANLVIKRFSALATSSVLALVVSGFAAAYARLDSFSDLWISGYGRLVVVKVLFFTVLIAIASRIRKAISGTPRIQVAALLSLETAVMAIAVGLGTALHATPISRSSKELPSAAEELLGFVFPAAPSFSRIVTGFHPEWLLLTGTITFAGLYLAGVRKLRKQNIQHSRLQTFSFVLGMFLVAWATSSNISRYAMVSFSSHMIQHMVLSMIAPILIVLGGPITLALRALPSDSEAEHRNIRGWIVSLLHSKYSKLVTHPLIVLVIFTFGLYGIYFTSAFGSLMSGHVGHLFMEVHFIIAGILFTYVVIGVDPSPRHVPYWARLILVIVALSLHAFFAIALMQSTTPIGREWYAPVMPPWITNPLDDTYAGGGVAWALGEVPTLILMIVVAIQWSMSDTRLAKRLDRAADRDGDAERNAYNERLARLNQLGKDDN